MANKKITDATTATSVAGTDKVFLNQGGDLKQVDLNSAVANSQAVQTLNSNLVSQIYRFNDFELNKDLVGKTTLIGTITPPNGFTIYDILAYNIYYISSGDVNYGNFYIPAGTNEIYFTYLKHGFDAKGISLKITWKK